MTKIAVCLLAPDYAYPVFYETALLYQAHLKELGYEVELEKNRLKRNSLNLLIGYHYLNPQALTMLAGKFRYILIQLEQLSYHGGWFSQQAESLPQLLPIFKGAEQIWDYDKANVEFLKALGLEAKLMPLGYHASLQSFHPEPTPDYDVIFYGALNSTLHPFPRRVQMLETLARHCNLKILNGKYGQQRDQLLKKAKLVLNIHGSENLPIKEQVRLFYLFTNQVLVVSEESSWNPYGEDLLCYPYDKLVQGVLEWLNKSQDERQSMANRGHARLKEIPFQQNICKNLSSLVS